MGRDPEELRELGAREEIRFRAVGEDAARAEHDDAIHLRRDVLDVVGDEEQPTAARGQVPDRAGDVVARGRVEPGVGLVEDQDGRVVDEGPRDEGPARLAGGERVHGPVREVGDPGLAHGPLGRRPECFRDVLERREADRTEEAGENGVPHGDGPRVELLPRARHDAEERAGVEKVPEFLPPEDGRRPFQSGHRVDVAREEADERRLSRPVRAEDSQVLPLGQRQPFDMEDLDAVPDDDRVAQLEEGRGGQHGRPRVRHPSAPGVNLPPRCLPSPFAYAARRCR